MGKGWCCGSPGDGPIRVPCMMGSSTITSTDATATSKRCIMIIAADTAMSTTMNCGTLVCAMLPSSPITAPMTGKGTIPRKLALGPVGRVNRKKESDASDGISKPRRRSSTPTKASTAVRMRTTATKAANHPCHSFLTNASVLCAPLVGLLVGLDIGGLPFSGHEYVASLGQGFEGLFL